MGRFPLLASRGVLLAGQLRGHLAVDLVVDDLLDVGVVREVLVLLQNVHLRGLCGDIYDVWLLPGIKIQ